MTETVPGPRRVDLLEVLRTPSDWVQQQIPGGSAPVRLHRLHLDRASRASVSLVEFPAGWSRVSSGSYAVAEEFVLLMGALEMNGRRHEPGDWAFVPAGGRREDTRAPGGALALAWFGGVPTWRPGEYDERCGTAVAPADVVGVLKAPSAGHGGTEVVAGPLEPAAVARDVLDARSWTWRWLPPGSAHPPGVDRLVVRSW